MTKKEDFSEYKDEELIEMYLQLHNDMDREVSVDATAMEYLTIIASVLEERGWKIEETQEVTFTFKGE